MMARLARTGITSALGKCDRRLDVPISEELESAITTMAALRGVPRAELARQILEHAMFGQFTMVQRMVHGAGGKNGSNGG